MKSMMMIVMVIMIMIIFMMVVIWRTSATVVMVGVALLNTLSWLNYQYCWCCSVLLVGSMFSIKLSVPPPKPSQGKSCFANAVDAHAASTPSESASRPKLHQVLFSGCLGSL